MYIFFIVVSTIFFLFFTGVKLLFWVSKVTRCTLRIEVEVIDVLVKGYRGGLVYKPIFRECETGRMIHQRLWCGAAFTVEKETVWEVSVIRLLEKHNRGTEKGGNSKESGSIPVHKQRRGSNMEYFRISQDPRYLHPPIITNIRDIIKRRSDAAGGRGGDGLGIWN